MCAVSLSWPEGCPPSFSSTCFLYCCVYSVTLAATPSTFHTSAIHLSMRLARTDLLNHSHYGVTNYLRTRTLITELPEDAAFFDELGREISQLSKLQLTNKPELESKIQDLGKMLALASSPYDKDMYKWREIFKTYQDVQVFVSDQESDRFARSSEKALGQLQCFLKEVERAKLVPNFKRAKSKTAFSTFLQLHF